ncbi:MAG TPA: cytochrome c oxidase assembly protein [Candidatus Limnocylindria bacterium]|nr:cytochrome c oxidase assembly protein [Candidatus Limnocylindria bacterium]
MTRRLTFLVPTAMLIAAAVPGTAVAHGSVPPDPPSFANLAFGWHLEPLVAIGLFAAAPGWIWLVRRIAIAHPDTPVPLGRSAAWFGGLAAIAVALLSGIGRYDTTLFSIHMVQHLLLLFIAAPLLVLAAPVTQLLRVATPDARRRVLLPVLHSTAVGAIGHPVVAWLAFTVVMWVSHFSLLFDLALENGEVHELEHALYLGTALLFWWPAIAADPARRRMGYPARVLYLLLQFPLNSFLGVAILFAPAPLYGHYASLGAPYGIAPLADQQLAGGIMWLGGDVVFIVGVLMIVAAWMRHETRDTVAAERRADTQRAALRDRADRLERRRANEAATAAAGGSAGPSGQPGSGDSSSAR